MQNVILFFVKLLVKLFARTPFWLIYIYSDALTFSFVHFVKYRKRVIQQNLRNSFPRKSQKEINVLTNRFYKHFCDILFESIKGLSMSKKELHSRFKFKNPEIFDPLFQQKQSVILMGSHYGNWEWGVISFPLLVQHKVIGIFKPIGNKSIEAYLNSVRSKWGHHLTSMKNTGRAIIENKGKPAIFIFIADQTPSDIKNAHWLNFLNQDTPFLHGAEKIAQKTGYPVFHFKIKRVKRGYYELVFEQLCLDPKNTPAGEITTKYARQLENAIRTDPPNWLWSHRRWKRKRVMSDE